MKQLFIRTDGQRKWLEKLATIEQQLKENAQRVDEEATFPFENFQKLREIGYTKITLPIEDGGEGLTVYDAILLQETLASYCGSTGLAASWTIQNVGEIFENRYWDKEKLNWFAKEVTQGATVNRAVSEFAMGSPGNSPSCVYRKGKII